MTFAVLLLSTSTVCTYTDSRQSCPGSLLLCPSWGWNFAVVRPDLGIKVFPHHSVPCFPWLRCHSALPSVQLEFLICALFPGLSYNNCGHAAVYLGLTLLILVLVLSGHYLGWAAALSHTIPGSWVMALAYHCWGNSADTLCLTMDPSQGSDPQLPCSHHCFSVTQPWVPSGSSDRSLLGTYCWWSLTSSVARSRTLTHHPQAVYPRYSTSPGPKPLHNPVISGPLPLLHSPYL